jgi:predicted metal-binding membrane protein
MDEVEAVQSLEMMRTTRGALAERARWSFARHAAVGLLLGGLIAGYALPGPWPMIVAAACMIATVMIVARDRQRDGFFVGGYRSGRTRWVTFAMLLVGLVALMGAIGLKTRYSLTWAPVAIGSGMVVFATIMSIVWERVYRRELDGAQHGR